MINTVVWYIPDLVRNCVKAMWWYFPRISLSDDISHEFNIVFVKRTVLLELSLQPVRLLKNLFFVTREAYVMRAKRKGNLIVAVICALDTLTNYLQKLLVLLRVSLLLIVWSFAEIQLEHFIQRLRGDNFFNFVFYHKVMIKGSVRTNFLYGYPAATYC